MLGNAAFPSAGTTNLHIDMSDAVNVMVRPTLDKFMQSVKRFPLVVELLLNFYKETSLNVISSQRPAQYELVL